MSSKEGEDSVNPGFLEFIKKFADLHDDERLFPKQCRSCGQEFFSFEEFLCHTIPKKHVLEDYSRVMKRPHTMVYRHCPCGNTLVLTLNEDIFPSLNEFWKMLGNLSEERGVPLAQVVGEFVSMCDCHLLLNNPCLKPAAPLTFNDPSE